MDYRIREIKSSEYSVLSDFLYEAIFVPDGMEKPPRAILSRRSCKYMWPLSGKKTIGA